MRGSRSWYKAGSSVGNIRAITRPVSSINSNGWLRFISRLRRSAFTMIRVIKQRSYRGESNGRSALAFYHAARLSRRGWRRHRTVNGIITQPDAQAHDQGGTDDGQ